MKITPATVAMAACIGLANAGCVLVATTPPINGTPSQTTPSVKPAETPASPSSGPKASASPGQPAVAPSGSAPVAVPSAVTSSLPSQAPSPSAAPSDASATAVPLTEADLVNKVFVFRRGDGSLIANDLVLLPGGKVGGMANPNESSWGIDNGQMVFFHVSGAIYTRMTTVSRDNGKLRLSGPFIPDPVTTHVLTEK